MRKSLTPYNGVKMNYFTKFLSTLHFHFPQYKCINEDYVVVCAQSRTLVTPFSMLMLSCNPAVIDGKF